MKGSSGRRDTAALLKRSYQNIPRGRRASRNKGKRNSLTSHGTSSPSSGSESEGSNGAIETSCPHCKKSYRQNNSFYKHLYEHHPQWCHVSEQFGLSKHKQVMLMQAVDLLLSIKRPDEYAIHPLVRF